MTSSSADVVSPPTPAPVSVASKRRRPVATNTVLFLAFGVVLVVVAVGALAVGRYTVPVNEIVRILTSQVFPIRQTWYPQEYSTVIDVRLPRVLLSVLIGGGLALTGAVMQGVFRNPLASAQMLGVSSGASFGGVLVLLTGAGGAALVGGAFFGGIAALLLVLAIGRAVPGAPLLMIILGGTVVGAMFQSMVSFVTYIADPYSELPSIVFWLMGSLGTATYSKVLIAAVPILVAGTVMLALRWRLNILAMGDEDATAMGIRPGVLRGVLLVCVALLTAGSVAVAGVVGWVGLVVPHLVRMMVGQDNRRVLPISVLLGASYLTVIDTIARSATSAEIPIGILTAIIGAPFFVLLLFKNRSTLWGSDV
ncbi:iron ABC transporter permease [Gordonia sp. HY002]|uniref:FecCD family ABC transporter permease n=1 Tax=Gordonia zhenghanii TaxID=2911516 RepID=UPI001EF08047|nr:iron ABC transporter permease [Gordonia zhenghanii]MCF8569888.1 iron ABC transporter permease [Gordonia zhenghanii]MCF8602428.1 iron ABC transporter permease [Gordonia zhenghanii]